MVPNVKWVIVSHYGNVNLTKKIFMANRFRSEMTSFVLEDLILVSLTPSVNAPNAYR